MCTQRQQGRFHVRRVILAALVLAAAPMAGAAERSGALSVGGGLGFLADTTDGTAFALNFQGDYFMSENVSLGPLVQLAFTGDLSQVGASGQAKYWLPMPGRPLATIVFQGGVGFVHADHRDDDTSFLVPLGIGVEYELNRDMSVNATFLVNFTDLDTGRGGDDTTLMPGLTFGIRF
ncbi:MAG: porin family protein [Gammaproteobacteria bacterium]|nr:porin family protein [Gammaproteobacteria bacterium]NIR85447.1 porin family protein [Gammaproteobacteria bacterium]NIR89499.1 porin family protein [Gammaproteobacteria bacterium]NIU06584.1 porin family protein [Gammaproteobacteria bacterium]NIV53467.1 outer membrane beta-barrel protein [Gammaproteobacteria bacterium]